MHGIRHVLDPGTPGYAALKLSAVAGVAGLQVALRRRSRRDTEPEAPVAEPEQRRSPHPRSRKRKRRRRP